jgi:F420-dependent oxidoreductase-like protein
MRIGIQVPIFDQPGGDAAIGPAFAEIARTADASGLDSLWVMDHFFQIPPMGAAERPMLEGYSALAFAAGITNRIKLGTMVTGNTYRYPGLLVKTATTLDVLSGGRAYLGIGAGWFEREHLGLGVPFPPTSERFERLEETLRIAHQMWSDEVGPFEGRHYRLAETLCLPMPLSKPHPPILVGGGGEKKTLKLVARYADACNLFASADPDSGFGGGTAELRHKLDVLRGHCEAEGRPYEAIEKTTLGLSVARTANPMAMTPDVAVDLLGQLADLGVDHHIFGVTDAATVELIASEVLPHARRLGGVAVGS